MNNEPMFSEQFMNIAQRHPIARRCYDFCAVGGRDAPYKCIESLMPIITDYEAKLSDIYKNGIPVTKIVVDYDKLSPNLQRGILKSEWKHVLKLTWLTIKKSLLL